MQNPRKQGPDSQGSTAELITGLVQLVPQSSMPDIAQEAMEVRGTARAPGGTLLLHSLSFRNTLCVCVCTAWLWTEILGKTPGSTV